VADSVAADASPAAVAVAVAVAEVVADVPDGQDAVHVAAGTSPAVYAVPELLPGPAPEEHAAARSRADRGTITRSGRTTAPSGRHVVEPTA